MPIKTIQPEEPEPAKAKAKATIFDRYHPVIELVIELLPLRGILTLEQVCHSLKQSIAQLTGPFWRRKLGARLPKRHPLLWYRPSSYSRATISFYAGIQQGLRSECWPQRCTPLSAQLVRTYIHLQDSKALILQSPQPTVLLSLCFMCICAAGP